MKISTKGRYGLRALIDLAANMNIENVTIKTISERQNVSERYLEQIFSLLRKGGIIIGRKGAQGGYTLSRKPEEYTILELLKTLEGENILIDTNNIDGNDLEDFINTRLWKEANEIIENYFNSITLQDLVDDYNKSKENLIYYI